MLPLNFKIATDIFIAGKQSRTLPPDVHKTVGTPWSSHQCFPAKMSQHLCTENLSSLLIRNSPCDSTFTEKMSQLLAANLQAKEARLKKEEEAKAQHEKIQVQCNVDCKIVVAFLAARQEVTADSATETLAMDDSELMLVLETLVSTPKQQKHGLQFSPESVSKNPKGDKQKEKEAKKDLFTQRGILVSGETVSLCILLLICTTLIASPPNSRTNNWKGSIILSCPFSKHPRPKCWPTNSPWADTRQNLK